MLFFYTPGNSISSTPPVWIVSGIIAQYSFKDRSTLPGPTFTGSLEVVLSNKGESSKVS